MNALVYVDIDQGIHKVKTQKCLKGKRKKTTWVFFFYKHGKFWSILLKKKVELKPLFRIKNNNAIKNRITFGINKTRIDPTLPINTNPISVLII